MSLLHRNDSPGAYPASWYAATADPLPPCPPLEGDVAADVCIVGAGYTGLSAALHLAEAGLSVRVLEAQRIGFGASGRNGGQVGSGQRVTQDALEKLVPQADAQALWQVGEDAKALVRHLIARHAIDCHWRSGIVEAVRTAAGFDHARRLADKLTHDYAYAKLQVLDAPAMAETTGSTAFAGGVLDTGAGHLHPLRFVLGLARAAQAAGAILHEGAEVTAVAPGTPVRASTASGTVTAPHGILACNGYLGALNLPTAARVMPINNFVVATEPLDAFPEILPTDVAVADDRFVVNYWRRSHDNRMIFGGGESYGYTFPRDIAGLVAARMRGLYPQLATHPVTHAWGGTLAITRSRLPWFGRPGPGLLTASGYSGHGVALATLAGALLAEAVRGPSERFELMARLPVPPFPGGAALRSPILMAAMSWYALRDRLGV